MPGDPIGGLNKAFKYLYQIRLLGKRIKKFNKTFYYALKYSLVALLLYWIFA
jgi:beta-hydroxylase